MPQNYPKIEEDILRFWQEKRIFEKTLEKTKRAKPFVFYDGPPFATGLPHYGHILSSVIKDVVPRYKTMRGFFVRRRWGWDCHGLPIENLVEKELGVLGKKDIENKIGVAEFNKACRLKVLTYTKEWKKMVDRIGRFVEFDNAYKTMDSTYMESVWSALKTLWDKGLVYEGKKVLMYCPHCETPVSKAEVAMDNSYKDVTEEAVTVKFKVKDPEKRRLPENTHILAWTTTPWTLPANVALAVGEKIKYILAKSGEENYILAEDRVKDIFSDKEYKKIKDLKGKDIAGLEYEPVFEVEKVKFISRQGVKKAWYVLPAGFVNTEEGTGVVHTAVIYGEDDYALGVKNNLPMAPLLGDNGVFNEDSPELIKGKYFKNSEKLIKEDLERRGLLFSKNNNTHPYPFCWRCGTQLFYNAISAWFINIQKDKKKLIKLNEKINWHPDHLKHGRFLNIVKDAPDWNISRNRFWATPLPFFKCECGNTECVGSVDDLKKKSVNFSEVFKTDKVEEMDLHKEYLDKIKLKCKKCDKKMERVPEVVDCWVESSSMPYAELHYPFESKELFKKRFPAQYIAEYIAQTRTWFYYMHAMGVLLFNSPAFENVVSTGTILNEKGDKLSKSKQNYTDPWVIINQYGVDALRFYLMASPVMASEDLSFTDKDVREAYNKVVNTICNVAEFYKMYAPESISEEKNQKFNNILDRWILSRLNNFIAQITKTMDEYDTIRSCRLIKDFIEDLSLWYVRRSRNRFKVEGQDKTHASIVLRRVLMDFSRTLAPILPFTAEFIFEKAKQRSNYESVHMEDWPEFNKKLIDNDLEEKMAETRKIVSLALAERAEKSIRVRQSLQKLIIKNEKSKIKEEAELLDLIKDEVNIKEIVFDSSIEKEAELDINITEELKEEGILREITRFAQDARKKEGLKPQDKVSVTFFAEKDLAEILEKNRGFVLKEINAKDFTVKKEQESSSSAKEIIINGQKLKIKI